MWKVESEKYDEEFELMKKDFEVAYPPNIEFTPTSPLIESVTP